MNFDAESRFEYSVQIINRSFLLGKLHVLVEVISLRVCQFNFCLDYITKDFYQLFTVFLLSNR